MPFKHSEKGQKQTLQYNVSWSKRLRQNKLEPQIKVFTETSSTLHLQPLAGLVSTLHAIF